MSLVFLSPYDQYLKLLEEHRKTLIIMSWRKEEITEVAVVVVVA